MCNERWQRSDARLLGADHQDLARPNRLAHGGADLAHHAGGGGGDGDLGLHGFDQDGGVALGQAVAGGAQDAPEVAGDGAADGEAAGGQRAFGGGVAVLGGRGGGGDVLAG